MILTGFGWVRVGLGLVLVGFGLISLWIFVQYSLHSSHGSLGGPRKAPGEIVEAPNEIRRSSK